MSSWRLSVSLSLFFSICDSENEEKSMCRPASCHARFLDYQFKLFAFCLGETRSYDFYNGNTYSMPISKLQVAFMLTNHNERIMNLNRIVGMHKCATRSCKNTCNWNGFLINTLKWGSIKQNNKTYWKNKSKRRNSKILIFKSF